MWLILSDFSTRDFRDHFFTFQLRANLQLIMEPSVCISVSFSLKNEEFVPHMRRSNTAHPSLGEEALESDKFRIWILINGYYLYDPYWIILPLWASIFSSEIGGWFFFNFKIILLYIFLLLKTLSLSCTKSHSQSHSCSHTHTYAM